MKKIIKSIREELRDAAEEKRRISGLTFFREEVRLYGVTAATVKKISRKYYTLVRDLSREEVVAGCDSLWMSGMLEESFIACAWSEKLVQEFTPADFNILERWVHEYVSNWASCDTLCNHTVGDFIRKYPEYIAELKRWTTSDNRWVRRAAAVSLIIPAREGLFSDDVFEIAGLLLNDTDDMVQKGYGWLLKVTSQAHQKEVFDYVIRHKAVMPRTALRYAIEKMPPDLRAKAMEK